MEYRQSMREQARTRLAQIDREIAEILRVFPDLRIRRSRSRRRPAARRLVRPVSATWRRVD
jgi:hypothetical protein